MNTAAAVTKVMRSFDDLRESSPGGSYFVRSRTDEHVWWLLAGPTCSCPAGRQNAADESERLCWHQKRLMSYISAVREAKRPPAAPINVGAFCD